MRSSSFLDNQTFLWALEFTLAKKGFGKDANQTAAATALIKKMKSKKSVSGRHQQLTSMLKKGATLAQMIKASGSSRRTIFRYLNNFEEAGAEIKLQDGKYKLHK